MRQTPTATDAKRKTNPLAVTSKLRQKGTTKKARQLKKESVKLSARRGQHPVQTRIKSITTSVAPVPLPDTLAPESQRVRLTDLQKRYVVQLLAVGHTPTDTANIVRETWGIKVSKQLIQSYDPTTIQGERLSGELRRLFTETRAKYLKLSDDLAMLHMKVRVAYLQRSFERQFERGNDMGAAKLLEQIAREVGGDLTKRREIAGTPGQPAASRQVPPAYLDLLTDEELTQLESIARRIQTHALPAGAVEGEVTE